METSTINNALQSYTNNVQHSAIKTLANGDKEVYGVKLSSQTSSFQTQASVVSHFFSDQAKIEPDSMKLTYQAAIAKINDMMNPDGENPFITQDKLNEKGIEYWSAENTANRIIEGASFFLAGFQKVHPELEGEALMDKFNEVIGGGLRQGFAEAKDILGELKVFDGNIEKNFNITFDLVEQGMLDFRNQQLATPPEKEQTKADID